MLDVKDMNQTGVQMAVSDCALLAHCRLFCAGFEHAGATSL